MEPRSRTWRRALAVAGLVGFSIAAAGACWVHHARLQRLRRRRARGAAGDRAPSLAEELRDALAREAEELAAEVPSEELQAEFTAAAAWVGSEGGEELSTNARLRLYGCYKQVSVGDAPPERPRGMEASMKWEAWHELCGTTRGEAMRQYVAALDELAPAWRGRADVAAPKGAAAGAGGRGAKAGRPQGPPQGSLSGGLGPSVSTMGQMWDPDQASAEADETPVGQLCAEIAVGNVRGALLILERQPELAFKTDKDGMAPLHWAADRGEVEVARALVHLAQRRPPAEVSACLNAADGNGDTPLHYAVNTDNAELARLLAAAGADASAENKDGETPLQLAAGQGGWDEGVFAGAKGKG